MIKRIQRKIVLVMVAILALILIAIELVVYFSQSLTLRNETSEFLVNMSYRAERPNDKPRPEDGFMNSRSIIIWTDSNLTITNQEYPTQIYTEEEITNLFQTMSKKAGNEKLYQSGNTFYYSRPYGTGYIFTAIDQSVELEALKDFTIIMTIGLVSGFLALSVVVYLISFWIIKPLKESLARQKQFISDASHELKTPLTIINANLSVVSGEIGQNQWLDNIQYQTVHMNKLVNDMLALSKVEETPTLSKSKHRFDASKTILNSILPFDAVVYEENKTLETDIAEGIEIVGDEESLKKAIGILVDNALKYSDEKGLIKVSFKAEDKEYLITVYNTGCEVQDSERAKLFERFYRADSSHNQKTGGSGLGLAIVNAITSSEGWKISVDSRYHEYMAITIAIPKR